MARKPEYVLIAEEIRAEVLDGRYDDAPLPSNTALSERFDVNLKTAGRAVQHLVAEGLLQARPGMRAVPVPAELRATEWSMSGRYARARAAQSLVFGHDAPDDLRKETTSTTWTTAPVLIAHFLRLPAGSRVLQRTSQTHVGGTVVEDTAMFFPEPVVQAAPTLETADQIRVVTALEDAGLVVHRTVNKIRARLATDAEQTLFNIANPAVMIEHAHGTYGEADQPLEAVINVRPADNNVISIETYEAPLDLTTDLAEENQ